MCDEHDMCDIVFRETWRNLAECDLVDGLGGAEFNRVFEKFVEVGRPMDNLGKFILRNANLRPGWRLKED